MKEEHATVRMVREWVRIDVHFDHYDVTAQFLFRNDGPAVTVAMGFPEKGYGDIAAADFKRKSGFKDFATWVDGREVTARRELSGAGEIDYTAYWVKQVAFDAGQRRTVRVRYRSPIGEVSGGERFAAYEFTGGNWMGRVEQTDLLVVIHTPGTSLVYSYDTKLEHNRNRFSHRWVNWEAEGDFHIHFLTTDPGWLAITDTPAPWRETQRSTPVTLPGEPEAMTWQPPGLVRGERVFIGLYTLADIIARNLTEKPPRGTRVWWDQEEERATVAVGGYEFHIWPDRAEILTGGMETIVLPSKPLSIGPDWLPSEQRLYVPLQPILAHLGGSFKVEADRHCLAVALPRL